jgi:hypothetical protein
VRYVQATARYAIHFKFNISVNALKMRTAGRGGAFNAMSRLKTQNFIVYIQGVRLVWYPGQNKRIAPLSFLYGCRKRRLKD